MEQSVVKVVKVSSREVYENNWAMRAEETRIVQSRNLTETAVSIVDFRNAFRLE